MRISEQALNNTVALELIDKLLLKLKANSENPEEAIGLLDRFNLREKLLQLNFYYSKPESLKWLRSTPLLRSQVEAKKTIDTTEPIRESEVKSDQELNLKILLKEYQTTPIVPRTFSENEIARALLNRLALLKKLDLNFNELISNHERDIVFTTLAAQKVLVEAEVNDHDGGIQTILSQVVGFDESGYISFKDHNHYHWKNLLSIKLLGNLKLEKLGTIDLSQFVFPTQELEPLLALSGMRNLNLDADFRRDKDDIKFIQKMGAQLVTINDLNLLSSKIKGGFLLGNHSNRMRKSYGDDAIYNGISEGLSLVSFFQAYSDFGIGLTENGHTEKFMEKIASTNRPIVILIPTRDIGKSHGATSSEYQWLINHPEVLSRTVFVFGTYLPFENGNAFDQWALRFHPEFQNLLIKFFSDDQKK